MMMYLLASDSPRFYSGARFESETLLWVAGQSKCERRLNYPDKAFARLLPFQDCLNMF